VISEGTQNTPQQRAHGIGIAITAVLSALTKRAGSIRHAICTFVWFSSLLFFSLSARAQYRFKAWTADDGLPQNIIRGMHQTPDGYLWIATLDGMARFGGTHFKAFNKGNTPGIISNRFNAMVGGQDGDLWMVTESGRITRYHNDSFHTYGEAQGLPEDTLSAA
jgi:ligand-binding sensor domain-containing protein